MTERTNLSTLSASKVVEKSKDVFVFLAHQFFATWGLAVGTRWASARIASFANYPPQPPEVGGLYWALTGTPFFPVQILTALAIGWLLSRWLHHRSMLWVWIAPSLFLCYAFFLLPTLTPHVTPSLFQSGVGQSRMSHYFGTACRPENFCFDQVLITLPFYISVAYAAGALLARRTRKEPVLTALADDHAGRLS
jgi:hypothetical protein